MGRGGSPAPAPDWTNGATHADAFRRGFLESPSTPVIVVVITFVGFGALARDVGLDISQALFITAVVFALPGQVVLVDEIAHGTGLVAAAFAVTLTAVRLLPLTFSLMPLMRDRRSPRWLEFVVSHIIAITLWIEAMRRLPALPHALRMPYFSGFGTALIIAVVSATYIGFVLSANVPTAVAAGFVFLTPIYFFLSLVATASGDADTAALAIGSVMGPVLFLAVPGFDLFLTGLAGGTLAYGFMKWRKRGISR